jgi:hypothetical protein
LNDKNNKKKDVLTIAFLTMEMKRYNTDPLPLGKKGGEKLEVLINIEKHEKHEN